MKILLVNPEFPLSFWSLRKNVAFLGHKTLLPPLGLLTVAALLPQEWEFRLADLNTRPLTSADWQWADLVMITGMLIQRQGVLSLIGKARNRRKIVVVGGPYANSLPLEILEAGADFLVRGEGETTIPRLLAALQTGQPRVIEEDHKPEITLSPVPRFDLLILNDYLAMSVQTSRGCPFDCEFCDIASLYGRKPRFKDPRQVLVELETLYRLGWRRDILINDDNFIGNRDHALALLRRLIPWMQSHGEPFSFGTQASVNLGQDREMIDLMTAANFSQVFLGVETPDPEILSRAHKYQNVKNPLGQSLHTINANGLTMIASFVLGFDHEKPGAGDRICEFVEEYGIPVVMLNLLQAAPHSRLWNRLQKEGRLLADQTSGDSLDLNFNYLPTRPQMEILGEYVRAINRLCEPSRFLARAYRYYRTMRPTRAALARQQGGQRPLFSRSPRAGKTKGISRKEWGALIHLFWHRGIRPRYRWQFWRQFLGICRYNPSRLDSYLIACFLGEELFALRKDILKKWQALK